MSFSDLPYLRYGVCVIAGFAVAKLHWMYRNGKHRSLQVKGGENPVEEESNHLVLFFPDAKVSCKDFFDSVAGCRTVNCMFSHEETGLRKLLDILRSAKQSIDVCVFMIACHELVDVILQRHKRRVRVRVVTDAEMSNAAGSQTHRFLRDGIKVRTKKSPFHMHHKFAVVDGKTLIMGSFNWTNQAVMGNFESVIVTNDKWAVEPFNMEFERLWQLMDPVKKEINEQNNS